MLAIGCKLDLLQVSKAVINIALGRAVPRVAFSRRSGGDALRETSQTIRLRTQPEGGLSGQSEGPVLGRLQTGSVQGPVGNIKHGLIRRFPEGFCFKGCLNRRQEGLRVAHPTPQAYARAPPVPRYRSPSNAWPSFMQVVDDESVAFCTVMALTQMRMIGR